MNDSKYGRVEGIREGEPVFIVRAQDPLAYLAVRQYRALCIAAGCDEEHLQGVKEAAHRIKAWQEANPEKVKDRPGPSGRLPHSGRPDGS